VLFICTYHFDLGITVSKLFKKLVLSEDSDRWIHFLDCCDAVDTTCGVTVLKGFLGSLVDTVPALKFESCELIYGSINDCYHDAEIDYCRVSFTKCHDADQRLCIAVKWLFIRCVNSGSV